MSTMESKATPMPFRADPMRYANGGNTGIYIRGQLSDGSWANLDLAELDRDSTARFLNSRDAGNLWAVNTCLMLLDHEPLKQEEFDTLIAALAKVTP